MVESELKIHAQSSENWLESGCFLLWLTGTFANAYYCVPGLGAVFRSGNEAEIDISCEPRCRSCFRKRCRKRDYDLDLSVSFAKAKSVLVVLMAVRVAKFISEIFLESSLWSLEQFGKIFASFRCCLAFPSSGGLVLVFRRDHSSSLMLAENPNSFNLVHLGEIIQKASLSKICCIQAATCLVIS